MSLSFISLNSGSNGNCYYVGNETDAVLIDAGISCREVEKRLKRSSLDIKKVKAVFISHEHSDHIRGLEVLAKKHFLPVYITEPTFHSGRLKLDNSLIRFFSGPGEIQVGSLSVYPFSKLHDAADPYSFVIASKGINVGVFTDIGAPCANLIEHFSICHAALLESNYDEEMLEKGNYPYYLRKRIRSDKGHLSNDQALELFRNHRPAYLSHLVLTHLSKNNNSPALVEDLFTRHAEGVHVSVAPRYSESPLFHLSEAGGESRYQRIEPAVTQMNLFEP